jgi:Holliday junction resolvase RusA-like endonuclease
MAVLDNMTKSLIDALPGEIYEEDRDIVEYEQEHRMTFRRPELEQEMENWLKGKK